MKKHPFGRGVLITVLFFAVMVGALLFALQRVETQNAERQTAALKDSVLQATLTCYAVEGRYPSDALYLEEHYGLTYNHKRYIVSIDSFAQNLLPDIRVLVQGEGVSQ